MHSKNGGVTEMKETDMTRKDETVKKPKAAKGETLDEEYRDFLPTQEQIRSRAHELYRARCDNGVGGDEQTDWIAAERELEVSAKQARTPRKAGHTPASQVRE